MREIKWVQKTFLISKEGPVFAGCNSHSNWPDLIISNRFQLSLYVYLIRLNPQTLEQNVKDLDTVNYEGLGTHIMASLCRITLVRCNRLLLIFCQKIRIYERKQFQLENINWVYIGHIESRIFIDMKLPSEINGGLTRLDLHWMNNHQSEMRTETD